MLYESSRQPLSYGHIISFSPPNDAHSFVFSDGFISSKTILKNFKTLDPSCKYLNSHFQIYPSFLNSGKKAALNLKEELKIKYNEASEQKKRVIIQDTLEKVSHEYKFNQETYEKLKDSPISFDTPVQFLHITSNKFLACNFDEEAEFEKENFKLGLSEYPSENTFLKFLPVYTYQKRNDGVIYLHDTVYLVWSSQYLNKIPYIHVSADFSKKHREDSILPDLDFETSPKNFQKKLLDSVKMVSEDEDEKYDEDNLNIDEENNSQRKIPGMIGKPGKSIKEKLIVIHYNDDVNKEKTHSPMKKILLTSKAKNSDKNVNFKSPGRNIGENFAGLNTNLSLQQSILSIHSSMSKKEINISLDSKSLWKIHLICANISDKNILCYGDIVWLNYSEKNATLIATEILQEFERLHSKKAMNYNVGFVSSVFADQQYQNFLGDTNGMWMIEHEDYRKGGMIEWGTSLRLKHLISGRYLSIESTFDKELIDGSILFEMVTTPTKNTLFEFTILPTTISKANPIYTKYIPKDAFMKMKHISTKSWIRLNYEVGGGRNNEKGGEKNLDNVNTGLTSNAGDEIAFKIFKANENEVWETNFLISCKPFLYAMLEYLQSIIEQTHVILSKLLKYTIFFQEI